jgi:hypothetical protein
VGVAKKGGVGGRGSVQVLTTTERQVKTYRKPKNAVCQKSSLFKGFIEHAMDK